jgi:hypothetical protein
MRIAQGQRVKRAPPWVIEQNESKPRRAKENVDKTWELLSSLTGLDLSRSVYPPFQRVGYFQAALRALNTDGGCTAVGQARRVSYMNWLFSVLRPLLTCPR